MGKSEHGPDMQDCLSYLYQMDHQGGYYTSVLLMPNGSLTAPSIVFNVLSSKIKHPTLGAPGILTVYDGYPSRAHTTFNGAFYRALVEHDKQLSQAYFLNGLT